MPADDDSHLQHFAPPPDDGGGNSSSGMPDKLSKEFKLGLAATLLALVASLVPSVFTMTPRAVLFMRIVCVLLVVAVPIIFADVAGYGRQAVRLSSLVLSLVIVSIISYRAGQHATTVTPTATPSVSLAARQSSVGRDLRLAPFDNPNFFDGFPHDSENFLIWCYPYESGNCDIALRYRARLAETFTPLTWGKDRFPTGMSSLPHTDFKGINVGVNSMKNPSEGAIRLLVKLHDSQVPSEMTEDSDCAPGNFSVLVGGKPSPDSTRSRVCRHAFSPRPSPSP
jgi:hypothetical protein